MVWQGSKKLNKKKKKGKKKKCRTLRAGCSAAFDVTFNDRETIFQAGYQREQAGALPRYFVLYSVNMRVDDMKISVGLLREWRVR